MAKKCACAEKEKKQRKDPKFHKEDLLWAYFCIRMINEVLSDPETREKLKESRKDGPENMFELAVLHQAAIKKDDKPADKGKSADSKAADKPKGDSTSTPGKPPAKPTGK